MMFTKLTGLSAVLLLFPVLILPACQSQSSHGEVQFIDMSLQGGDEILIAGNRTTLESLPGTLAQVVDPSRSHVVIRVDCRDSLPMNRLHQVQRGLCAQGLVNMSYRTRSGDELTLILPTDDMREQVKQIPSRHIATLRLAASGNMTLDGVETKNDAVEGLIAGRLADNDRLIVSIDLDPNATYGDFIRVFGATKRANAPRIHLNDPS